MSSATHVWYVFGAYRLCPSERVLLDANDQRIKLPNRQFDVLHTLVTVAPANSLVTKERLWSEVWRNASVDEGNLPVAIAAIRRALGDLAAEPKYVDTCRGHGYRLIPPVEVLPSTATDPPTVSEDRPATLSFEGTVHRFVPVFLGPRAGDNPDRRNRWGEFSERAIAGKLLRIFPWGVGVWYEQEVLHFASITEYALRRRQRYRQLLREPNELMTATQDVIDGITVGRHAAPHLWTSVVGRFPYVLSAVDVRRHNWADQSLRHALKLVCSPRVLCPEDAAPDPGEQLAAESRYLAGGFEHADLRSFGLHDRRIGYASWAGVSLLDKSPSQPSLASLLVDYEMALQATWALGHCLTSVHAHSPRRPSGVLKKLARTLRETTSRLSAVGPTDPLELRTMLEAVLTTSRLESQVTEVCRALHL
jgi:DNA-binding winged helix-turn-helix (wHTH) protein